MVGFGRTEKSLSLSCTEFQALSHGHGFRAPCFNVVRKSRGFHETVKREDSDFWFFGLKMIPNDRARSGRGPWRVFGLINLENQRKLFLRGGPENPNFKFNRPAPLENILFVS